MSRPDLHYCPTVGSPFLLSDNSSKGLRRIFKTRCKLWQCAYCGKVNAHQHKIRILNGINKLQGRGYEFNFVTLTSHEALRTFEQTLYVWRSAWRKLSERLRRLHRKTTGLPPHYVYIPETHKDGRLHVHGLFSGNISKQWFKENGRSCGLGYMVDTQELDNAGHATAYITKYIAKNIGQDVPVKRFRRVNYSRGFPPKPTLETEASYYKIPHDTSLESVIWDGWRKGYRVELNGKQITEIVYDD